MPDSVIGISVSDRGVQAVEVMRNGPTATLLAIDEWENPFAGGGLNGDQEHFQVFAEAVRRFLGDNGIKSNRVSLALDTSYLFLHSVPAEEGATDTIRTGLDALVTRNPDFILSAALRLADGTTLAVSGNHAEHWDKPPGNRSTLAHAQVPIYHGNLQWGTLEVSFIEARRNSLLQTILQSKVIQFIGITLLLGFGLFLYYMRRTLRYLDPSAVIPDRVKAAFDIVPAGIILLDAKGRIVLANDTFRDRIAGTRNSALGNQPSKLSWQVEGHQLDYPWVLTQRTGAAQRDVRMKLQRAEAGPLHLNVSTSPIKNGDGSVRGVLVALDDLTELDKVNEKLRTTIQDLRTHQCEIARKNEELKQLATRDPLTGCLNRREFFERAEPLFMTARDTVTTLCCIMCDIDCFKHINDNYGHIVGDLALQEVAKILLAGIRQEDLICRYGGEEFCIMLRDMSITQAVAVAERLRTEIQAHAGRSVRTTQTLNITSSFGVAVLAPDATDLSALIDHADRALYVSKKAGRNRVTRFDDMRSELQQARRISIAK